MSNVATKTDAEVFWPEPVISNIPLRWIVDRIQAHRVNQTLRDVGIQPTDRNYSTLRVTANSCWAKPRVQRAILVAQTSLWYRAGLMSSPTATDFAAL